MTHDGDVLARHAIPGTFRAHKIRSTDLPDWFKEKIEATEETRPTDFCLHLYSGPQTIVRRVESPQEAMCTGCHGDTPATRACALCRTKMAADLSEWDINDREIPLAGGGLLMRFSAARCPACSIP
ncbi:hypothetical protein [Streptomyces violaceusniger]|uniref:Uncharacterized protein n=1 Tax=Streptomyces violaceusniger (strain Tu 4113) TaxID=653045 RepID=G2PI16_STRV4|nr:hypothetical protein [Streptomyces violaceusniger]AEM88967.1 hypothetical protein Strvi_0194 [Streptomyces violaceusniger Tu 4113]